MNEIRPFAEVPIIIFYARYKIINELAFLWKFDQLLETSKLLGTQQLV